MVIISIPLRFFGWVSIYAAHAEIVKIIQVSGRLKRECYSERGEIRKLTPQPFCHVSTPITKLLYLQS
jgi:hypothetical protein